MMTCGTPKTSSLPFGPWALARSVAPLRWRYCASKSTKLYLGGFLDPFPSCSTGSMAKVVNTKILGIRGFKKDVHPTSMPPRSFSEWQLESTTIMPPFWMAKGQFMMGYTKPNINHMFYPSCKIPPRHHSKAFNRSMRKLYLHTMLVDEFDKQQKCG